MLVPCTITARPRASVIQRPACASGSAGAASALAGIAQPVSAAHSATARSVLIGLPLIELPSLCLTARRPEASASPASQADGAGGLRGRSGLVFLVADVVAPAGGAALLVDLLHRDVRHEAVGRGAVPVLLAGLEVDAVAGVHHLDRAAAALAAPDPLGHVDGLAERMRVPGGAGARREVHAEGLHPGGGRRHREDVDVDMPGEPVAWPEIGVERVAGDLHAVLLRRGPERDGATCSIYVAPGPRGPGAIADARPGRIRLKFGVLLCRTLL